MKPVCICPIRDWFHLDHSWTEYSSSCPVHAQLDPGGMKPTQYEKEETIWVNGSRKTGEFCADKDCAACAQMSAEG
jgi:hypothetical protein